MVRYPLSSSPSPQLGQRRASPRFSPVQIDFSSAIEIGSWTQVGRPAKRPWRWRIACRLDRTPTPNYRIGVKNERGLASGFLHQSVGAGSRLEVSAPRGSFTLPAGATPVMLISAGVGVTPMLAMLHVRSLQAPGILGRINGCIQPAIGRTIRLPGRRTIYSPHFMRPVAA